MSSLRVVSDCVISSHPDPLRHRSVLLDLLSENAFQLERLNSSLQISVHSDNLDIEEYKANIHRKRYADTFEIGTRYVTEGYLSKSVNRRSISSTTKARAYHLID